MGMDDDIQMGDETPDLDETLEAPDTSDTEAPVEPATLPPDPGEPDEQPSEESPAPEVEESDADWEARALARLHEQGLDQRYDSLDEVAKLVENQRHAISQRRDDAEMAKFGRDMLPAMPAFNQFLAGGGAAPQTPAEPVQPEPTGPVSEFGGDIVRFDPETQQDEFNAHWQGLMADSERFKAAMVNPTAEAAAERVFDRRIGKLREAEDKRVAEQQRQAFDEAHGSELVDDSDPANPVFTPLAHRMDAIQREAIERDKRPLHEDVAYRLALLEEKQAGTPAAPAASEEPSPAKAPSAHRRSPNAASKEFDPGDVLKMTMAQMAEKVDAGLQEGTIPGEKWVDSDDK